MNDLTNDSDGDLGEVAIMSQPVATAMATTRQAQEVQAAMIVAKRFPRDEDAAAARILKACKRTGLAEAACYEYTKGGTKITGPSIRLAEVLAQNWGNVDFGFVELERRPGRDGVGESVVQCHAWDLETNTRRAVVFNVRHCRDTRQGSYPLRDEREIYEMIANQSARRVRACVLAIIPGDIQDSAVEQCEKTLAGQSTEPLSDRIRKMLVAFEEVGVSKAMIEKKLNHVTSVITHAELARLLRVFTSIRDGIATPADHFHATPTDTPSNPANIDELKKKVSVVSADTPHSDDRSGSGDEPDTRDEWTQATDAVNAATKTGELTLVADYWAKHDFGPQRNTEFLQIVKRRQDQIRAAKGGKKQQNLMDTSPTANSEGA